MPEKYEDALRETLGEELHPLLDRAEELAQQRGVFERRREYHGYYTIEAALILAIAVWEVDAGRENTKS